MSRPAIFLDRDGTINAEADYLGDPADVVILPGAARGIRLLRDASFCLVVISNQSGVARGLFSEDAVKSVNAEVARQLAIENISIDAFYYCPHLPDGTVEEYAVVCPCRKPAPGMLFQAALDADIDLAASYTIGDSVRDLAAGRSAGTRTVLVLTGYGKRSLPDVEADALADYVAVDLVDAANWIIADRASVGA